MPHFDEDGAQIAAHGIWHEGKPSPLRKREGGKKHIE
jgi:hypothetical protein